MKGLPLKASDMFATVVLLISFIACLQTASPLSPASCHCDNASHCGPIGNRRSGFEFLGFTRTQEPDEYKQFDWTKLTTAIIVDVTPNTKDFACYAHSKNTRVTLLIVPQTAVLDNTTARQTYVAESVMKVMDYGLDGINVDYEGVLLDFFDAYDGLTELMRELRTALMRHNTTYTLSQDYIYCPDCVFGRTYNLREIEKSVDYFIIMNYDMQVTWMSPYREGDLCPATANAPYRSIYNYTKEFIWAGVRPKKLVMALPWYGYMQQCVEFREPTQFCYAKCQTLNTGKYQICYSTMLHYYHGYNNSGVTYSNSSKAPFFTFNNEKGELYQINYDDPKSLREKYQLALDLQLRGGGTWDLSCLGFPKDARGIEEVKAMWSAIPTGM